MPSANWSGTATVNVSVETSYSVRNDGDITTFSFTINVSPVNDAPIGTSATLTINEDAPHALLPVDFGFTDPNDSPGNAFSAVKITSLPLLGTLKLNGSAVTTNDTVSVSELTAGHLIYTPGLNANGAGYAGIDFKVQDVGLVALGGVDLDTTVRTLTFDVTAVNAFGSFHT